MATSRVPPDRRPVSVAHGEAGEIDQVIAPVTASDIRAWTCNHFSISEAQGEVARLLRKVADSIDELGNIEILDVTFNSETVGRDPDATVTVYFSFPED